MMLTIRVTGLPVLSCDCLCEINQLPFLPALFIRRLSVRRLFIQRLFYPAPFLYGAFLNRMPFKTALSQKTRNQRTFQHSTNLSRAIVHTTPIYFRRFNPNLIPLCTNATMGQNPILRPSRSYQQPRGDILTMYPLTNRSIYQRIFLKTYVLTDALAGRWPDWSDALASSAARKRQVPTPMPQEPINRSTSLASDYTIEYSQDLVLELFFRSSSGRLWRQNRLCQVWHWFKDDVKKHRKTYPPRSNQQRYANHVQIVWMKIMRLQLIALCQVTSRGETSTFYPYQCTELIRIFLILASVSWTL